MACVASCNSVYTSCIQSFNIAAITYDNPYGSASSSNTAVCENSRSTCVANCGWGGGGGGGGAPTAPGPALTDEQLAALQRCADTLVTANADGDALITHDEFLAHVELYASALCPGAPRPTALYADEFEAVSCLLCTGILDPFDPSARDGDCPCVDAVAPAGPIDDARTTAVEAGFYCDHVLEVASISCTRPERACFDGCYADEATCQAGCDIGANSPADAVLNCMLGCNGPFYECVGGCPSLAGDGDGGAAGGAGGAQPNNNGYNAGGDEAEEQAGAGGGAEEEVGVGRGEALTGPAGPGSEAEAEVGEEGASEAAGQAGAGLKAEANVAGEEQAAGQALTGSKTEAGGGGQAEEETKTAADLFASASSWAGARFSQVLLVAMAGAGFISS